MGAGARVPPTDRQANVNPCSTAENPIIIKNILLLIAHCPFFIGQMQIFYSRVTGSVKDRKKFAVRRRAVHTQNYQTVTVLSSKRSQ
jgi:hypothetical protein